MDSFTSLRTIARTVREREEGETLGYEVVTLAMIIFAVFGVISLVGRF